MGFSKNKMLAPIASLNARIIVHLIVIKATLIQIARHQECYKTNDLRNPAGK